VKYVGMFALFGFIELVVFIGYMNITVISKF